MRKLQLLFFALFCAVLSFGQLPQGINLQMIVRNHAGALIPEKQVELRFTLVKDSIGGTPIYQETQQQTTNLFGLVNVVLGQGTEVFGNFASIQWQDYNLYLKQELDLQEGDGYQDMGTAPLLSVSYAMVSGGLRLQSPNGTEYHLEVTDQGDVIAVIHAAPEASFTATPLEGNPPLTVTFTGQSSNAPTSWQWDFGDGATSTEQHPVHEYTAVGDYTVTLSASNAYGVDMEIKEAYVYVGSCPATVTDIDGNSYNTVLIGEQCWMQENLKVTHYPNGDAIPYITDGGAWDALGDTNTDDAYCYYDNNMNSAYGVLYSYAAAIGDNWARDNAEGQGICPEGWHLPTDAEWITLTDYLGGEDVAGGKMKEVGTGHWQSPNTGATNESGFTALPGGYRDYYGTFRNVGNHGTWWSATVYGSSDVWYRYLSYETANVNRNNHYKSYGFSVRCIWNN
ncbi:MAG: hypothetical protein CSA95_06675 [Bacteroidetes bacterium]|nr:MAG: hypothetical protein CSA95_06675 [Bacteroidota bacterium]PIE87848.1 MAG: hypothetical protein CSA04_04905 [Bacteroidota bacterium]